MTMHILMLLTDQLIRGGTQNDVLQLSGALVQRGHQVTVAAPTGPVAEQLAAAGVTHRPVVSPLGGVPGLLRYTAQLCRLVRQLDPDLIAPQSLRTTLAAGLLRHLACAHRPVLTSIHNLHDPSQPGRAARVLRHGADMVTFENRYEAGLVNLPRTAAGKATQVVYSGIDLERFRPSATRVQTTRRRVGCVARLSPEKNHRLLLAAWQEHVIRRHEDQLILVGDGPMREAIEAEIAIRGLHESVFLLGDRDDVPEILPTLDVFVLASSRESYPRSAREALACGVPVILPSIGGCGEIALDPACSSLFESDNVDDLVRQLHHWTNPQRNRAGITHAARSVAERRFAFDRWIDTMEKLYLEQLQEPVTPIKAQAS